MECCGKAMSYFHMKSTGFHKICWISCVISQISKNQLPGMVSPMFLVFWKKDLYLVITQKLIFMKFGGFHKKSGRFHMKLGRFHMKCGGFHLKSTYKPYKSNNSRKTLQFYGVLWEGYVMFSHEICRISCKIHRISKDQLPGMVSPMFSFVGLRYTTQAVIFKNKGFF